MINRNIYNLIVKTLKRDKSILLLGPRQTGKTTIIKTIEHDKYINLMDISLRQRYEADSSLFAKEIITLNKSLNKKPRIIIDEIQKIPSITDSIQILIDDNIATFIITGSSARKITNLLPGRVVKFQMFPLSLNEINHLNHELKFLLTHGSLPGIINTNDLLEIEQDLGSYVSLYLEEEIRKEALVRNLGAFNNFLRLACIESGNIVNLSKISQEIGVSHNTISEYYQILIDCMVAKKIEPLTKSSSRRKLAKSPKYIIFDLGIRRLAANESNHPNIKQLSLLFEQFIGLELEKLINQHQYEKNFRLLFWRDHAGPEIDFILEHQGTYIPIEVKWTTKPNNKDIKHLTKFMQEYSVKKIAYVVCQTPYPYELAENIMAISWKDLNIIFD